jgi:hypothetical protein
MVSSSDLAPNIRESSLLGAVSALLCHVPFPSHVAALCGVWLSGGVVAVTALQLEGVV